MKWWKKALIGTVVLFIVVAGIAFIMFQQIHKTSADAQIEDIRDNKMGSFCGEIFGAGAVVIWFVSYKQRNKNDGNQ
jgi:uncharacterized membrane protein